MTRRHFTATLPNQLWVSDFTYVATWRSFIYGAFVIDVFARRTVDWRAAASMRTDLALDALEQAIYDRCDGDTGGPGAPQRPRHAVPVDPLHRAPRGRPSDPASA